MIPLFIFCPILVDFTNLIKKVFDVNPFFSESKLKSEPWCVIFRILQGNFFVEDTSPFCGATDIPVLNSHWVLSHLHPMDSNLLMACMATGHISYIRIAEVRCLDSKGKPKNER